MKKICFVAEYMLCGGTEKSLISLLDSIDRKKYQITLLLMEKKGVLLSQLPDDIVIKAIPLPEDERDDLLHGKGIALRNTFKKGQLLKCFSKAIRGLKMKLASKTDVGKRLWYYKSIDKKVEDYPEEFDVAIDYFGYGLFNTFYVARKIKAKKRISWVHFEPDSAIPDFYDFKELLVEFDKIMCVSKNVQSQLNNMIPAIKDKTQIFYNIIDKKDVIKKSETEAIYKENGYIHILSIGRLDYQKGFDLALNVIDKIIKDGYKIRWHIVGEGQQRKELEAIINRNKNLKNSVILHGQQTNPYPFIKMCDIYFQPSRYEAYCITVAEARALCKPIIATDFAGAREQLKNGETGIITKCREEDLYLALKMMLENKQLQVTFVNNLKNELGKEKEQIQVLQEIFDKV